MPFFKQKMWNFYDLRTFDAKFCRENFCTFSADFFGLKNEIRRKLYFLDVCTQLQEAQNTVTSLLGDLVWFGTVWFGRVWNVLLAAAHR